MPFLHMIPFISERKKKHYADDATTGSIVRVFLGPDVEILIWRNVNWLIRITSSIRTTPRLTPLFKQGRNRYNLAGLS